MTTLFGIDIAGIVSDAVASAGGVTPAVLTSVVSGTRTPGAISAGTNPTNTDYPCQALGEHVLGLNPGSLVQVAVSTIVLIARTIAGGAVSPKPNDRITIGGVTYTVAQVITDAAGACHECKVVA